MDQAVVGLVVRRVVDCAHAEPAANDAAFDITNVESKTAIVSKLHKRRRVLSGLPAKSMFAAVGKAGFVGNAMRQTAETAGLNKPAERTFVPSACRSQFDPKRKSRVGQAQVRHTLEDA
jgi:hypothetical protein